MSSSLRRQQFIQQRLESKESVLVADLALELEVSEMTVRRDLRELERMGLARRTHGGAVREVSRSYEPPFELRMQDHHHEKVRIAAEAVRYVHEGDTIAIDTGTTAVEFARQLVDFQSLTIVTPSLHIAQLFLHHPSIKVILSGGEMRKQEGSLVGDFTRTFFENLYFDTFFLSSACLDVEAGITEFIMEDASIKRLIISHAKKTIALMASSKFNLTALSKVCSLDDIDVLVTDQKPGDDLRKILLHNGVEIRLAQQEGDE